MPDDGLAALVDDLEAEQVALQAVLADLDADDWLRPTPAWSWDVRDTVAHLADTDEMALDTMHGGPRALGAVSEQVASTADVTFSGVVRGRRLPGAGVLAWWEHTSATERDGLRASTRRRASR